ncbi:unnamed protein product [Effrenium voratum]|nr:unnamed protein product [Effrenium voratum]
MTATPCIPCKTLSGTFSTCFPSAFGCPRQGLAAPFVRGQIQLAPWMQMAGGHFLAGLEAFSHVWVIFLFDQNRHSSTSFDSASSFLKPTVRPPWLAGEDGRRGTRGVFATRSPHRPNPVGLTLCRLDRVDQAGATIYVSGVDVVDGSAVLDIKPYHPVDAVGQATPVEEGTCNRQELRFADWLPEPKASAEVTWSSAALEQLEELQHLCRFYPDFRDSEENVTSMLHTSTAMQQLRMAVDEVIGLDPRPPQSRRQSPSSRRSTTSLIWAMDFDGLSFVFRLLPGEGSAARFQVVQVLSLAGRAARLSKDWLQELQAEMEDSSFQDEHAQNTCWIAPF